MNVELSSLGVLEAHMYGGYTYAYYRSYLNILDPESEAPAVAVGASIAGKAIGLGMAVMAKDSQSAQLLSIFTEETHRRQGVALSIIQELERIFNERGCPKLTVAYERGRPYTEAVEGILKKAEFSEGVVHSIVCRCFGDRLKEAPWMQKQLLPSAFEVISWGELSDLDREEIAERQKRETWFPQSLNPFQSKGEIETLNSLALRYRGEIVGWQINHRTAVDTIRYTSMFVREDLQPYGLALPLMIASIRRQIESPESVTVNKATFMVPAAMEGMRNFVENRMAPFLDEVNQLVESDRILI